MLADLKLERDKKGNIVQEEAGFYNPGEKEVGAIKMVANDFRLAYEARQKPYREFGNETLTGKIEECEKMFNAYIEDDLPEDEKWRSKAFRPIARNKVISFAAHLTSSLMFPKVFAQNENQEEDKEAASFMRDAIEWVADQSDYDKTFFFAVLEALVNPAVIVYQGYSEVFRKIKEMKADGGWTEKEIVDELYSGYLNSVVPLDEIYIPDFYIQNIQAQPFIIRRRVLDVGEVKQKYAEHDNMKYVTPGVQVFYDEDTEQFYQVFDDSLDEERGVEEIIYWNRNQDLRLVLLNGILVTDSEQPNPRKDKDYPFAKGGFETISSDFFYHKSLVDKVAPDQNIINRVYRMVIDGSFLQIMPPAVKYGGEDVEASIVAPGAVTNFQEPDTKVDMLDIGSNLSGGLSVLQMLENSVSESSAHPLRSGQLSTESKTAYEISQVEQNARTIIQLSGRMIGDLVEQLGDLMVGDVCQFMTVPEVDEISGVLKYRKVILPDKSVEGKTVTKEYRFNPDLDKEEISATEKSAELLDEQGEDRRIYEVNPTLIRRKKYLIRVEPGSMVPPSDAVQKVLNLELYDRAIANPHADQRMLLRDVLYGSYEKTRDNVSKYMRDVEGGGMMAGAEGGGRAARDVLAGVTGGEKELKQLLGS